MTGGPVEWQARCGGPTGTGHSNAYFVASLNGGARRRGQSFIWGGTGPPVEPPLFIFNIIKRIVIMSSSVVRGTLC